MDEKLIINYYVNRYTEMEEDEDACREAILPAVTVSELPSPFYVEIIHVPGPGGDCSQPKSKCNFNILFQC